MVPVKALLDQPWYPKAPPMDEPTGDVIRVADVEALFDAADRIPPGGTILIADGHYMMPGCFDIHTDGVTVRGESGDRTKVILDGARSRHIELFAFTNCRDVTAADLTIQNIQCNGFKINANKGTRAVAIHNCVMHNIWQRGVKGVRGVPKEDGTEETHPVEDCRVEYCLFYNDRPKQLADDDFEAENPSRFGGNYIAGMDIMDACNWVVADNVLIGIRGRTGAARGAIFMWQGSRDVLIERNILIDCDSGMWLGLSGHFEQDRRHCVGYTVRNNFITRCHAAGILLNRHRDSRIVHNTIHVPQGRSQRGPGGDIDDVGVVLAVDDRQCHPLRVGYGNHDLLIANNLLSGPNGMRISGDAGRIRLSGNVEAADADCFADPARGDLHVTRQIAGLNVAAERLDGVPEDIDGNPRGKCPTLGAHERT